MSSPVRPQKQDDAAQQNSKSAVVDRSHDVNRLPVYFAAAGVTGVALTALLVTGAAKGFTGNNDGPDSAVAEGTSTEQTTSHKMADPKDEHKDSHGDNKDGYKGKHRADDSDNNRAEDTTDSQYSPDENNNAQQPANGVTNSGSNSLNDPTLDSQGQLPPQPEPSMLPPEVIAGGIINSRPDITGHVDVNPDQRVIIIQPGDTLSELAEDYNTTVHYLATVNGIVNPDLIYAYDRLIVPKD